MKHYEKVAKHYNWSPEFFETFAPKHYSCLKGSLSNTFKLLEGYLDIGKNTVLEIGYGRGEFSRYLRNQGYDYQGIDASKVQQNYCDKKSNSKGWYLTGDFHDIRGRQTRLISNEILVHIPDHLKFFKKCASLQKKGDVMVHKEMHLVSKDRRPTKYQCFVKLNNIFYHTGKYHTLKRDLIALDAAGYDTRVENWDIKHYIKTIDKWIVNMILDRKKLIKLEGRYRWFITLETWITFKTLLLEGYYEVNVMISTKR